MKKLLGIESDGDRYPKDIYIINSDGFRVATIEGHNESSMFRFAKELVRRWNAEEKRKNHEQH